VVTELLPLDRELKDVVAMRDYHNMSAEVIDVGWGLKHISKE
jgi:hypothetical protein